MAHVCPGCDNCELFQRVQLASAQVSIKYTSQKTNLSPGEPLGSGISERLPKGCADGLQLCQNAVNMDVHKY